MRRVKVSALGILDGSGCARHVRFSAVSSREAAASPNGRRTVERDILSMMERRLKRSLSDEEKTAIAKRYLADSFGNEPLPKSKKDQRRRLERARAKARRQELKIGSPDRKLTRSRRSSAAFRNHPPAY
jgi:hypothetical protein